ncbi:hypothetical protein FRC16_007810 [Serendipita sp. 398]|nr:hypothetical protein FRC16_007810 [Serendipita sp. 398]
MGMKSILTRMRIFSQICASVSFLFTRAAHYGQGEIDWIPPMQLKKDLNDRETDGYTALDYVQAITNTLNRHDLTPGTAGTVTRPAYPVSAFVTHLVYLSDTPIRVQEEELATMGVSCIAVTSTTVKGGFNAETVAQALDDIISTLDDTDSP